MYFYKLSGQFRISGVDLRTSLRLLVRSWILCVFCVHIFVYVAIKIKFKPTGQLQNRLNLASVFFFFFFFFLLFGFSLYFICNLNGRSPLVTLTWDSATCNKTCFE